MKKWLYESIPLLYLDSQKKTKGVLFWLLGSRNGPPMSSIKRPLNVSAKLADKALICAYTNSLIDVGLYQLIDRQGCIQAGTDPAVPAPFGGKLHSVSH